jgi:hypothetical protein
VNIEDDFMEIGNTGLVPIGEGLFWDKVNNKIVDLSEVDNGTEEDA